MLDFGETGRNTGDLPTEELVAAHTKNLLVFRSDPECSNWQEVRLRKLAEFNKNVPPRVVSE